MVGRDAQLASLLESLAAATDGVTQTAFVSGEAGVGKTRILVEHLGQATRCGVRVLLGSCQPLNHGALPYGPIAGALRTIHHDPDIVNWLDPARRSALAPLLPLLGSTDDNAATAQTRLFELLLNLLTELAEDRPVVLALEDLHWSDMATLDALAFLVRNAYGQRLQIIATFRSDELHFAHPLRPVLAMAGLQSNVLRLDLAALDEKDTTDLVAQLMPEVSLRRRAEVVARSGGNPFLAEVLSSTEGTLPETLRDHVAARVAPLPVVARRMLQLVAAGGQELPVPVLERACQAAPVELGEATRLAVRTGLLVADRSQTSLRFRHALFAEVIDDELLPAERQELHRALAEALLIPGRELTSDCAGAVARHWLLAGQPARAFGPIVVAARAAAGRLAYADAAALYEKAVELSNVSSPESASGAALAELHLEFAESLRWIDQLDRAIELSSAALNHLPVTGAGLIESRAWERLARYHWERGSGPSSLLAARRSCEVLADCGPSKEHARALSALAAISMLRGDHDTSIAVAGRAVAMARTVGSVPELSYALNTLGTSLASTGEVDRGITFLRESLSKAREAGALEDVCRAYNNLAYVLDLADRLQESVDVAMEGLSFTRRYGLAHSAGAILKCNAAATLLTLGRWTEARELLLDGADRVAPGGHQLYLDLIRADLDISTGAVRGATFLDDHAPRVASLNEYWATGLFTICRVEALFWDGQPRQAFEVAIAALDGFPSTDGGQAFSRLSALALRALIDSGEELRLLEGIDGEQLRRIALQIVDCVEPFRNKRSCQPMIALCDAELARSSDGTDGQAWRSAATSTQAANRPYLGAYALFRLAEAQLSGREAGLDDTIRDAARQADELGARPLLARIEQLAEMAGVAISATAPTPMSAAQRMGLTTREREVLGLLKSGTSNRQIARTLFITEKTASVHVSNILAKMGVDNRGQAAALAHKLDASAHQIDNRNSARRRADQS